MMYYATSTFAVKVLSTSVGMSFVIWATPPREATTLVEFITRVPAARGGITIIVKDVQLLQRNF